MFNIKDTAIKINNTEIQYIAFGKGKEPLVMIPGLGDGLKTVKGTGLLLSLLFKDFGKKYRVYVFSRRNILPEGFTTRDMAADLKYCLDQLALKKINLLGISQGGMISQYFAIDYPQMLKKLIIAVSLSRPNKISKKVISTWYNLAMKKQFRELAIDTMEKTYTGKRLEKSRKIYPFAGLIGKPKSVKRFLIQANACLYHNAYEELRKITAKTLVVGGLKDQIVGSTASAEMAKCIQDAELIEYPELGHGASDEKIFFNDVLKFMGG